MSTGLVSRKLAHWDAFTLRIDLDMLELFVNRELIRRVPALRSVHLEGDGDTLEITVTAAWHDLPAMLQARVTELRVYRQFLGCKVVGVRGPLGVPLPMSVVGLLVRRLSRGMVTLDRNDRILLVDLRPHLPDGVELHVQHARCDGRWLNIELGPGSVTPVLVPAAARTERPA
jgi:hypothetical protein